VLPKCSASVGDTKRLHNDANGSPLTAHVVVQPGQRRSEMTVHYGATRIKVKMVWRAVFFNANMPHATGRIGGGEDTNVETDKLYLSAYWGAPLERLLMMDGLM
jgi:hypothetical protein